jgi:hypothetical protein
MRLRTTLVATLMLVLIAPTTAFAGGGAASGPTCSMPESNADGLEILSTYYQGYWWNHTHLTAAVHVQPKAHTAQVRGVHDAIEAWDDILRECFDGLITLTDITGTGRNAHQVADITVHYSPHFAGNALAGLAVCGRSDCGNVIVGSLFPPGQGGDEYSREYLEMVTMHELGHALGLGHATNLEESTDLMGYGWPDLGPPVISRCDVDALAFVFAWALNGEDPHPPADGPFDCG